MCVLFVFRRYLYINNEFMCSIEEIKKSKTNDEFKFVCKHCGKEFVRTKRQISKNNYSLPVFCCQKCQKEWYKENSYVTVKCENCGKEFKILKGIYNQSETKHFFCDNSCAATYNNKVREKKNKTNIVWKGDKHKKGYDKCPICGKEKYYKSELCSSCRNKEKRKIKERTLGSYIDGHKYLTTKCSEIRKDARRTIEESKRERVCAYCHNHEFDDILEVHHLKGILEFDSNATIGEINNENNLVWLCPNHHKMLEMGLIKLE